VSGMTRGAGLFMPPSRFHIRISNSSACIPSGRLSRSAAGNDQLGKPGDGNCRMVITAGHWRSSGISQPPSLLPRTQAMVAAVNSFGITASPLRMRCAVAGSGRTAVLPSGRSGRGRRARLIECLEQQSAEGLVVRRGTRSSSKLLFDET